MNASARHLIRKQTLEFSASTLPLAQRWEQKSAALVHDVIMPCLEDCFDRAVGEGEHVVIDRLEIDLGEITERNYQLIVSERLKDVLDKALSDLQSAQPPAAAAGPSADRQQPCRMSGEEAAVEAFIFYLRYGVLPWWFDRADVDETIWNKQWLAGWSAARLRKILAVSKAPPMVQRLIEIFDDETLGHFVAAPLDLSGQEIAAVWTALASLIAESGKQERRQLRRQFWREWIKAVSAGNDAAECIRILGNFVLQQQPLREAAVRLTNGDAGTAAGGNVGRGVLMRRLLQAVQRDLIRLRTKPAADSLPTGSPDSVDFAETGRETHSFQSESKNPQAAIDAKGNSPNESSRTGRGEDSDTVETPSLPEDLLSHGVFVQDAGLVLLHPFLPELFAECGLWREGRWCEAESAQAAVHLLAWLANGDSPKSEYRLPLHKILCGIAIEEPLMAGLIPDRRQQDSCIGLLNAVVRHWGALGNTSPDGLREGFICREGLLQPRERGWRLAIEKKAQDVLLSRLPWGISLIQLPWMDRQRIFVDWL